MPNCSKCSHTQAKLSKGSLCKKCFNEKIRKGTNEINREDSSVAILDINTLNDRNVNDVTKDIMRHEKNHNEEIQSLLTGQIDYLKKRNFTQKLRHQITVRRIKV